MNTKSNTASATYWVGIGSIVHVALSMATFFILARVLGPEIYGIYTLVQVVVGFGLLFAYASITQGVVRLVELNEGNAKNIVSVAVLLSLGVWLIIMVLAPLMSNFWQIDKILKYIVVLSFVIPIGSLGAISEGMLMREMKQKDLVLIDLIAYVFGCSLLAIIIGINGGGIWALIIGFLLQYSLRTFLLLRKAGWNYVKAALLKPPGWAKELNSFVCGFTLGRFFNYIGSNGDFIVVGRYFSPLEMGIYSRAYFLFNIPAQVIGNIIDKVAYPYISNRKEDREYVSCLYIKLSKALIYSTSLIILVAGGFGPYLIQVLLGDTWSNLTDVWRLLLLALFMRSAFKLNNCMAKVFNVLYNRAFLQFIYALCIVAFSVYGARYGLKGVATGVLCAIFIDYLLMTYFTLKLVNIKRIKYCAALFGPALISIFSFTFALIITSENYINIQSILFAGLLFCVLVMVRNVVAICKEIKLIKL